MRKRKFRKGHKGRKGRSYGRGGSRRMAKDLKSYYAARGGIRM